jgi:hypothetical protein
MPKEEFKMTTKLGEVQAVMTSNVKKSEDLWTILRVNSIDKSREIAFKPAEDLAVNDKIKITIEKI